MHSSRRTEYTATSQHTGWSSWLACNSHNAPWLKVTWRSSLVTATIFDYMQNVLRNFESVPQCHLDSHYRTRYHHSTVVQLPGTVFHLTCMISVTVNRLVGWLVVWLEFNVHLQHKYGHIRDDTFNRRLRGRIEGPHDAPGQLISCQFLFCTTVPKNTIWKGLQQGNGLDDHSRSLELPTSNRPQKTYI